MPLPNGEPEVTAVWDRSESVCKSKQDSTVNILQQILQQGFPPRCRGCNCACKVSYWSNIHEFATDLTVSFGSTSMSVNTVLSRSARRRQLTSKIRHPICVTVTGQDDDVVDLVVVDMIQNTVAVGAVAVPGIDVDCHHKVRRRFLLIQGRIHTHSLLIQLGEDNLLTVHKYTVRFRHRTDKSNVPYDAPDCVAFLGLRQGAVEPY